MRRGQGYTLRVSTKPEVHRLFLNRRQPLDNATAIRAQRKARREYANRVTALLSPGLTMFNGLASTAVPTLPEAGEVRRFEEAEAGSPRTRGWIS